MTKQEYVKQVVRNLNCLQNKKSEIEKQLLSDIDIALGEGRQLEEILSEMGEPEELAREFNENIGENKEQEKQKKKRRILIAVAVAAVVLAALAGAAYWAFPKTRDIGDSRVFSEASVEQEAEKVVESFSRGDYDTLESYYSEDMRETVTREMLEELKPMIGDDWGEYRGVGTAYMAEVLQRGKTFAIVQLNATYEKVSVTYTLTFNSEMELAGFYMK